MALAAGPVALVVGWVRPAPAARVASVAARPSLTEVPPDSDGPAGFAEVFLGLWLRSGAGEQSPAARALKAMAPFVRPPVWGKHPVVVEESAAVRTVREGEGVWSVTVAVGMTDAGERGEVAGVGVWYFAVPVQRGDGWSFMAGAPSEVAGPAAAQPTDSAYTTVVKAGPLAERPNQWAQFDAKGQSEWLDLTRVGPYGLQGLSGGTYHLDGLRITDRTGLLLALGEALLGPGTNYGRDLDSMTDYLGGGPSVVPPVHPRLAPRRHCPPRPRRTRPAPPQRPVLLRGDREPPAQVRRHRRARVREATDNPGPLDDA
ncbi:hypothetical protein [Streptomyces sp. NPDC051909]|uniref:hypothetical protein n=1 Tax=Streptomyces sp. NPDC051909 TaxID=3154944 RepID=UPI0034210320